jgi:hypothetical protein
MELAQTRQRWQGYEQATAFYRVFLASLLDMAWGRLGLWPSSLRLRCLRRYLVAPYAYRPYVYLIGPSYTVLLCTVRACASASGKRERTSGPSLSGLKS